MPSNTVRLHRVLRSKPERVYKAFLDPDAMVKWLPPNGFTAKVHKMDARVGGEYKMSFTNFTTGSSHSFGAAQASMRRGYRRALQIFMALREVADVIAFGISAGPAGPATFRLARSP